MSYTGAQTIIIIWSYLHHGKYYSTDTRVARSTSCPTSSYKRTCLGVVTRYTRRGYGSWDVKEQDGSLSWGKNIDFVLVLYKSGLSQTKPLMAEWSSFFVCQEGRPFGSDSDEYRGRTWCIRSNDLILSRGISSRRRRFMVHVSPQWVGARITEKQRDKGSIRIRSRGSSGSYNTYKSSKGTNLEGNYIKTKFPPTYGGWVQSDWFSRRPACVVG